MSSMILSCFVTILSFGGELNFTLLALRCSDTCIAARGKEKREKILEKS